MHLFTQTSWAQVGSKRQQFSSLCTAHFAHVLCRLPRLQKERERERKRENVCANRQRSATQRTMRHFYLLSCLIHNLRGCRRAQCPPMFLESCRPLWLSLCEIRGWCVPIESHGKCLSVLQTRQAARTKRLSVERVLNVLVQDQDPR